MRVAQLKGEYVTVAAIGAAPEAVWKVLADAAGYAAWNPEIVAIEGRFALGERIKARVKLGSGAIRSVPMRVTTFDAPSRMEWTGGLPFGLFVGRRTFSVTPRGRGTEFRLELSMTGPLAPLILRSVGDRQPEIDSFAAALKAHVERGGRAS
ncbi:MAG: SRPBCC domain-containing protein [Planctomycetes bacterium]|nr:SRPBCC domain-containing protein [Planctomycetota bacterium]MBI3846358.1 SRPBCC domain-containing protein [Planctomycetota bacterium]